MTEINELIIRIPGISEEEGLLLGKEVAEKIANELPGRKSSLVVSELNIRLNESAIQNKAMLATVISEQVLFKIKQATFAIK
jgi:hypothetical protein